MVHIPDPSAPYDCAPDHQTVGEGDEKRDLAPAGTSPPIADSFESPFIGKSLEECAKYIQDTPDNKVWNHEYFCVLGDEDKADDTITLVRSFSNGAVHSFPCPTDETGLNMYTALSDNFEEKLQMYQKKTKSKGGNDRSVGVPYEYNGM